MKDEIKFDPDTGQTVRSLTIQLAGRTDEEISADVERLTLAICGAPKCDHDWFGPGSSERIDEDGGERVCSKCRRGALEVAMWEDDE